MAVSVCETIEDDLPTQLDRFAKYLHHQEQVWFTLILICLQARWQEIIYYDNLFCHIQSVSVGRRKRPYLRLWDGGTSRCQSKGVANQKEIEWWWKCLVYRGSLEVIHTYMLGCSFPVKCRFVYAISANIFGKADGGGLARQRKQTDISQGSYSPGLNRQIFISLHLCQLS